MDLIGAWPYAIGLLLLSSVGVVCVLGWLKTPRYGLGVFLANLGFLALIIRFGISAELLFAAVPIFLLICIAVVNWELWEIPDQISLPGILLGCLLRGWFGRSVDGVVWAVGAGASVLLARSLADSIRGSPDVIGFGDMKMAAMLGAFLGWRGVAMFWSGILLAILLLGIRSIARRSKVTARGLEAADAIPRDGEKEAWVPPKSAVPTAPFVMAAVLGWLLVEGRASIPIERIFEVPM